MAPWTISRKDPREASASVNAGFTRREVIELVTSQGFKDALDFVYVPINFKKMEHFGET